MNRMLCRAVHVILAAGVLSAVCSASATSTNSAQFSACSDVDQTLMFSGDVEVNATRAGVAIPLEEAIGWGLKGHKIESVGTALKGDDLLIDIRHQSGDEPGNYTYIMRYVLNSETDDMLIVYINPSDCSVRLLVKTHGSWGGETSLGASVCVDDRGVRAHVGTDAICELIGLHELASACVSLVLSLEDEQFWFPGSTCLDCTYSGIYSQVSGAELAQLRLLSDLAGGPLAELPDPLLVPDGLGPPALHVEGNRIVNVHGEVVQLRGFSPTDPPYSLDTNEPILKRDLLLAKSWGANLVLIQVAPAHYERWGELNYIYEYVDNYVRWAGELDMYALVHWKANGDPWKRALYGYPHMVTTADDSVGPLAQLAARYRDCPWVLHQVWGETGVRNWDHFATGMEILVNVVREQNPNCLVLVPGVYLATLMSPIISNPLPQQEIVYVSDIYPWVWTGLTQNDNADFVATMGGVSWQDQAKGLLNAGYPLMLSEWGFGNPEAETPGHLGTAQGFGYPLMSFCEVNGISWVAHAWGHRFEVPMFRDYERTELFPFGEVVRNTLLSTLLEPPTLYDGLPPRTEVRPDAAAEDGCTVIDVLGGKYEVASAILQASTKGNWRFLHWEGPVDHPTSPVASTDLPCTETVVAVFARPWDELRFETENRSRSGDAVIIEGADSGGTSIVAYTPLADDDWGALFAPIADIEIPLGAFAQTDRFDFDLKASQRDGVHLFVVLFETNGEAFAHELLGLPDSGQWQEYSVGHEQFEFGGYGSPGSGNGVLDLDSLQRVTVYVAVLEHAGQTVELQLRNPRFGEAVPIDADLDPFARLPVVLSYGNETDNELTPSSCCGGAGSGVRDVATGMDHGSLLVDLRLRDNQPLAEYSYGVRYLPGDTVDDRLVVWLSPSDGLVYLLIRQSGEWVASLTLDDCLDVYEQGVRAVVPGSSFEMYFSPLAIADSCIDLRATHVSDPNEILEYPGTSCSPAGAQMSSTGDGSLGVLWDDVPWRLEFEEGGAGVAGAWKNGQRMDIDLLEHWGLDGSEIRGVQVNCVEDGCFVRFSLWEPTIFGEYVYQIHCWQEPEFLYVSVDPEAERAWMGSRIQDDDVDMHDQIEFVAADAYSATVFVHEGNLPTGSATSSALLDFDMALICVHDDGSVHEVFEIGGQ